MEGSLSKKAEGFQGLAYSVPVSVSVIINYYVIAFLSLGTFLSFPDCSTSTWHLKVIFHQPLIF